MKRRLTKGTFNFGVALFPIFRTSMTPLHHGLCEIFIRSLFWIVALFAVSFCFGWMKSHQKGKQIQIFGWFGRTSLGRLVQDSDLVFFGFQIDPACFILFTGLITVFIGNQPFSHGWTVLLDAAHHCFSIWIIDIGPKELYLLAHIVVSKRTHGKSLLGIIPGSLIADLLNCGFFVQCQLNCIRVSFLFVLGNNGINVSLGKWPQSFRSHS
mmetsp:Transcript_7075/g.16518  ORF Transcript_7075/g.16518 Transcript_7075/m.16518 type:complete len:211 (-) Transcript_7075:1152-1784(-)